MKPRIVLVTDPAFADDATLRCVRAVAAVLPAGALCVQLRDKRRPLVSLRLFALQLRKATREAAAWLVINGDPALARDVDADGVHLGGGACSVDEARTSMRGRVWVSVAAHSDDDVRRAVADGADAALVSPVFPTRSLGARPPSDAPKSARGLEALRSARSLAGDRVAVVALGGVNRERVAACAAAGAVGVAVMRALLASPAPAADAKAMHDTLTRRRT